MQSCPNTASELFFAGCAGSHQPAAGGGHPQLWWQQPQQLHFPPAGARQRADARADRASAEQVCHRPGQGKTGAQVPPLARITRSLLYTCLECCIYILQASIYGVGMASSAHLQRPKAACLCAFALALLPGLLAANISYKMMAPYCRRWRWLCSTTSCASRMRGSSASCRLRPQRLRCPARRPVLRPSALAA